VSDVRRVLAPLVLAVLVVLTGCAKSSADEFSGVVLHRPYHAPDTRLTDTEGRAFSLAADTDKRLTLVFFGYTHCPDECPTTLATLASALLQLDRADRDDVDLVFVTTDPARDTGPVVRDYLDHFDPSFIGATGRLPTILHVAEALGVGVEKAHRLPGGGYEVTHGTQVLALDGTDTAPVLWSMGVTAPQFAHDIHQLLS
jgi:protein SCO1